MAQELTVRRFIWFCVKLFVLAPVCLCLWWQIMPAYALGLGHVTAFILRAIFGYPIQGVVVHAQGVMNVDTVMGYVVMGQPNTLPIAQLVSNIGTFCALMLATGRLGFRRLALGTAAGIAILAFTHAAYLVTFYSLAKTIARDQTYFVAFAQVLLTLPFILWIVLAFWDQMPWAKPATSQETDK
ncbi:MAG: hypothetical protein K1Y02_02855 [Candidatus Hydrogenedentes bacterium]|nr:hypothetical protein [Candidatus Hydrogenedentota bacterium]